MVARSSHKYRRQGCWRRTPTRRHLLHKSEFPSVRRHSEGWGRRHSSQPPRGVEESPPASSASVNAGQGYAVREFLGTGKKEGGSRQRVGFASPDRVDTVECRGRRRGRTVGDTSGRVGAPQPPVIAVDMSAEVERFRVLVEQLSKEKEDGRPQIGPPKRACRREDFVPHCDEEMQEWTEGRQKDLQAAVMARQAPRSGEGLPTLVQSSAGVTTCYPRTVVSDAVCSGEHGEVIRVRCGMAGARVERRQTGPRTGESSPSTDHFFRRGWGGCQCKGNRGRQ